MLCCLAALCATHAARAGEGLVFPYSQQYTTLFDPGESQVRLEIPSLPNVTAHQLTFFHRPAVPVGAGLKNQELNVAVLGTKLLFPPSVDAVSTVVFSKDTATLAATHVGDEVYTIPNTPANDSGPLSSVGVYGHGVMLDYVLLQQRAADSQAWHRVAWWDFRNASGLQGSSARSRGMRISGHAAVNTTFAVQTGVRPQWLWSGGKHVLRRNDYDGEGNYYAEELGREEFDEDVHTCRFYTQTFAASSIRFGCQPGAGGDECGSCPHGKYSDADTESTCVPCPDFLGTVRTGSAECVPCPAGKYLDPFQGGMCADCAAGTYRDETTQASDKEAVNAGTITADVYTETCAECPQGKYGARAGAFLLENCTECAAGKYSGATGNATERTCQDCAAGTYARPGSAECTSCPANMTTLRAGTSELSCVCVSGYVQAGYVQAGYVVCRACEPGTYQAQPNQTACDLCAAGTFQDQANATACRACLPTQYAPEGRIQCQDCPANSITLAGVQGSKQDCQCDSGFRGSNGSACQACAPGKFTAIAGQDSCTACSLGKFQGQSAQSACVQCNVGTFSDVGQSVCEDCPANSALDDTVPDEQRSGTKADCECRPGFFDNSTSSTDATNNENCAPCPAGRYKGAFGPETCDRCPVGKYQGLTAQNSTAACQQCERAEYAPAGAGSCRPCPAHTSARWALPNATDCQCNAGYTGPDGGNCSACGAGRFKEAVGPAACTKCEGGTASAAAAAVSGSECRPCLLAEFAPRGSAECSACPDDAASVPPRDAITNCRCNAGSTGLDGQPCTQCKAGTYKPQRGSHPCTQCASGKFSRATKQAAEDACQECQAHEFAPAGSDACQACPDNAVSWAPRARREHCKCRRGFNSSADGLACEACRPGTFKHRVGAGACLPCPPGTFSAAHNASWASSCASCSAGTYSGAGATVCSPCGLHAVSDAESGDAASCECLPGFTLRQHQCVPCGADEVKAARGDGPCSPIPAYSKTVLGTQTWQCNAGYTLHSPETCRACARGSYKASPGNHACVTCVAPKTTVAAASTSPGACVDSVPVDINQDGVLDATELAELESRTHLHLSGLDGSINVTTGAVAQFAEDVVLELSGDFDKGEVFYQDQSAGGPGDTFAVDVDIVLDTMSAKGVEIVDIDAFDENSDDLTDGSEWNSIKSALVDVSDLARQGQPGAARVEATPVGEGGGVSAGLVAVFAVVFVALVAVGVIRRSLSRGGQRSKV